MTVDQEQTVAVAQAVLSTEETSDLIKLVINEPALGFARYLMVAQHFMGATILGMPSQSLVNQLVKEYSKNQWNILSRLMVQSRLGKMLDPRSIWDPYIETVYLQILWELKKHKIGTATSTNFLKNKELRLTTVITSEDLQNINGKVSQCKDLGILCHWIFVAKFMGTNPFGWHDDQKSLLSQMQSLLDSFKTGHYKYLQQLVSLVQSGKTISLKEISQEQEERLASMMKVLNGLFMFPTPR